MPTPETLRRHASLFDTMAQTVGLDLEELHFRGKLTTGDIEDGVLRCTGCTQPEACAHLLASKPDTDVPPSYCRNADLLRELQP
jgi:hypothetical protein